MKITIIHGQRMAAHGRSDKVSMQTPVKKEQFLQIVISNIRTNISK